MDSDKHITKLLAETDIAIAAAQNYRLFNLKKLQWRESAGSWNILECIEHLNLYGDFYLPAIDHALKNTKTKPEKVFNSGLMGGYFAKTMLPKAQMNKMKTFSDKNPLNKNLDKSVIDKFINQLIQLKNLLYQSQNVSLNKVKIKTSISGLIKFKLGDTLHFLVNHIVRHLQQIENIQKAMNKAS